MWDFYRVVRFGKAFLDSGRNAIAVYSQSASSFDTTTVIERYETQYKKPIAFQRTKQDVSNSAFVTEFQYTGRGQAYADYGELLSSYHLNKAAWKRFREDFESWKSNTSRVEMSGRESDMTIPKGNKVASTGLIEAATKDLPDTILRDGRFHITQALSHHPLSKIALKMQPEGFELLDHQTQTTACWLYNLRHVMPNTIPQAVKHRKKARAEAQGKRLDVRMYTVDSEGFLEVEAAFGEIKDESHKWDSASVAKDIVRMGMLLKDVIDTVQDKCNTAHSNTVDDQTALQGLENT
ncbi:MAG: hypothetical protein J3Q66DRAFT_401186 [Benniella sp.]|nr:MAG: hypothetical protein J3Q66DRAFT_401186 [Benniella sp.]